jgi:hypothetical protein
MSENCYLEVCGDEIVTLTWVLGIWVTRIAMCGGICPGLYSVMCVGINGVQSSESTSRALDTLIRSRRTRKNYFTCH